MPYRCWYRACGTRRDTARATIPLSGNEITGFAVAGGNCLRLGRGVFEIDLRNGQRERIAKGRFAEGGCILDGGLILNSIEPHELVWLRFRTVSAS